MALAGCGDSRPPLSMTDSGIEAVCSFEDYLTNCRYNIGNFPGGLSDSNNAFDGYAVMGSLSQPRKILGKTDLTSALQEEYGLQFPVSAVVLDFEVEDLYAQNTLLIGTPCNNSLVQQYLEISRAECETFFQPGDAVIASKQWGMGSSLY